MSTVTAMRHDNPQAQRLLNLPGVEYTSVEGDGDIEIKVEAVYFTNHGPIDNYRPALHVRGVLVGMKPYETDEIAYGVNELIFDPKTEGTPLVVDAFYEFTDEQLQELVGKGYFHEGFEPPKELLRERWVLPAYYKATVIAPQFENDAPLVFIDILDRDGLMIDSESSGLQLTDYFPDYLEQIRQRQEQEAKALENEPSAEPQSVEAVQDIFESEGLQASKTSDATMHQRVELDHEEQSLLPSVNTPIFDALMASLQAREGVFSQTQPVNEPITYTEATLDASPVITTGMDEYRAQLDAEAAHEVEIQTQEELAELVDASKNQEFESILGQSIAESVRDTTPIIPGVNDHQFDAQENLDDKMDEQLLDDLGSFNEAESLEAMRRFNDALTENALKREAERMAQLQTEIEDTDKSGVEIAEEQTELDTSEEASTDDVFEDEVLEKLQRDLEQLRNAISKSVEDLLADPLVEKEPDELNLDDELNIEDDTVTVETEPKVETETKIEIVDDAETENVTETETEPEQKPEQEPESESHTSTTEEETTPSHADTTVTEKHFAAAESRELSRSFRDDSSSSSYGPLPGGFGDSDTSSHETTTPETEVGFDK